VAPAFLVSLGSPASADIGASERHRTGFMNSIQVKIGPSAIREWSMVAGQVSRERAAIAACAQNGARCGEGKLGAWRRAVNGLRGMPRDRQVAEVNRLVNGAVSYRSEGGDRWSAPTETLAIGGDCEDYAIMKYVSLRALGFSDAQLGIVVLRNEVRGVGHAVLSVRTAGRAMVLDNLHAQPVSERDLAAYTPRYVVNASRAAMLIPTNGREFLAGR
jgi:predicted transglutaminase-like cysteine proteinase